MTELAEHYNPIGKAETLEVWRRRMRMPVPRASLSELLIRLQYDPPDV
jgi:hypothetical protein